MIVPKVSIADLARGESCCGEVDRVKHIVILEEQTYGEVFTIYRLASIMCGILARGPRLEGRRQKP